MPLRYTLEIILSVSIGIAAGLPSGTIGSLFRGFPSAVAPEVPLGTP